MAVLAMTAARARVQALVPDAPAWVEARAMTLDTELGTIERGKRADLVVPDGNPLEQIRNVRRVRWTIRDGSIYDAAALWRSVRFQP